MKLNNIKYTLLTPEQQMDSLVSSHLPNCMPTEFAVALGFFQYSDFGKIDPDYYWLSSLDVPCDLRLRVHERFSPTRWLLGVGCSCGVRYNDVSITHYGVRPVIPFSNISDLSLKEVAKDEYVKEVEYGEYPQYAASISIQQRLEQLYNSNKLNKTGKTYTIGCEENKSIYDEYVYNGKKYTRVIYENDETRNFSNGKKYEKGDIVWIEVTPLRWYIIDIEKIIVSKNIIASKIRFDEPIEKRDRDFKNTEMYKFLNTYFAKDIIPSKKNKKLKKTLDNLENTQEQSEIDQAMLGKQDNLENTQEKIDSANDSLDNNSKIDTSKSPQTKVTPVQNSSSCTKINNSIRDFQKEKVTKENPYGLNFEKVSEEDIIKVAIKSGVAVFLHGPSSEGKSARVKQIDPDCVIIYLRNASPESLNGKSVYNSEKGEMIDIKPTWLKKLEAKCEAEPDKLHIVFFDEMTNALPSIQGIAFNIVLDREVNGMWKLPENARIVAAGNEMKDSLSANQLSEPLFNRFAHVYIQTTPEKWLEWANENNIHPAICAYIAYTKGKALRSKYDGEKPNADPRKWEMASKMLYETGNPEVLRSLVGEDITREFVRFCNRQVITLEDVINGNYSERDIQLLDTSSRYATTMGLSQVDEENMEKVRSFVTNLGAEFVALFDSLWVQGNPFRLEKIAELRRNANVWRRGYV